MIIYLRRTDKQGYISLLEKDFLVSQQWLNRLVRAGVDLAKGVIRFYALIRADWKKHRLIKTIKFNLKKLIKTINKTKNNDRVKIKVQAFVGQQMTNQTRKGVQLNFVLDH
jgi:phenylacetate-coenzyme A ligase PaaK-like adenylate-forming protein